MRMVSDWQRILRYAWSIRLLALAGILSGVEAALPFFSDVIGVEPTVMSLLTFAAVAGAFVARLVAQKAFEDGDNE